MKHYLVALAWLVAASNAAAETSLKDMINEAASCSDASLHDLASTTCESPEKIAAMAVAKCQEKWNAVADKAIGSPSPEGSAGEHSRSVKTYSKAMEYEYVRLAELKAIDMRTAAGRCGFE